MGCRSDYMQETPEEASQKKALKELSVLLRVARPLASGIEALSYPPNDVVPGEMLDALTQFCCRAIRILEMTGNEKAKAILGEAVVQKWAEHHMNADLKRAESLKAEADAIFRRYGK